MATTSSMKKWLEKNPDYMSNWYKNNKEANRKKEQERYRAKKQNEPWILAYRNVKTRARSKKLDFDITEDYLKSIWTEKCPVLGIPLYSAVYEQGNGRAHKAKPHDNSPSVDRIDPSKGYVKGNVIVMSYRANMIKNCGTLEEHKQIVNFLSRYQEVLS
jgi:hypothetical protein